MSTTPSERISRSRIGALIGAVVGILLIQLLLGDLDRMVEHQPLFAIMAMFVCGFGLFLLS